MVGIILVTHGELALGFKDAVALILGSNDQFECVSLTSEIGPDLLREKIQEALARVDHGDGVLIMVDLFGGTPCNVALEFTGSCKAQVVTGVNLGMLLESVTLRESGMALGELASAIASSGREGIQCLSLGG